ncbi:MAG TPA: YdcF family protein, partial [Acetobacteraceae bacterium]|nr:YdcF family protein [Acetobacteraceae bacterium]
ARAAGLDPAPLAQRVTLGSGAASTHGNAEEIAAWARANRLRSLIVVTAFYHMPRALAEIGRALPDVTLYPASVSPARAGDGIGGVRLLAEEYTKYLGAELGLTALAPGPPPRLSAAERGRRTP